jgi:hypothetical protein
MERVSGELPQLPELPESPELLVAETATPAVYLTDTRRFIS